MQIRRHFFGLTSDIKQKHSKIKHTHKKRKFEKATYNFCKLQTQVGITSKVYFVRRAQIILTSSHLRNLEPSVSRGATVTGFSVSATTPAPAILATNSTSTIHQSSIMFVYVRSFHAELPSSEIPYIIPYIHQRFPLLFNLCQGRV